MTLPSAAKGRGFCALTAFALIAIVPTHAQEPGRLGPTTSDITIGEQRTRVHADILRVKLTPEQAATFSIGDQPSRDKSITELLTELSKSGETALTYRFDVSLDLNEEARLTVGQTVPVVTNVVVSGKGKVAPSVQYKDVGAKLDIVGTWHERKDGSRYADVKLAFEYSDIVQSKAKDSEVPLPTYAETSVQKKLNMEDGQWYYSVLMSPLRDKSGAIDGHMAIILRMRLDWSGHDRPTGGESNTRK